MNHGAMAIAISEAKDAAENQDTLEDKAIAAMKSTKNHWMVTDENEQFLSAVGALLSLTEGKEKERVEQELQQLKTLNAAVSGVPVNFDAFEPMENPIGLMKLWKEL